MLKAVLFDMDGTLGDTIPLCVESYRTCVEELGLSRPSAEEVMSHFGLSDRGVLGALTGIDPDSPALPMADFVAVYERLHPVLAPSPFAGAAGLLQELKAGGFRLGLITGKEHYTAQPTLRYYGFEGLFEWFGFGLPTHNCKHEHLARVMHEWNLTPDELVYVGDAPSDIELSHRVGVRIINAAWASTASRETEACLALAPDWRLTDFNQLLPLILSI